MRQQTNFYGLKLVISTSRANHTMLFSVLGYNQLLCSGQDFQASANSGSKCYYLEANADHWLMTDQ